VGLSSLPGTGEAALLDVVPADAADLNCVVRPGVAVTDIAAETMSAADAAGISRMSQGSTA
jgi:hypothetical protein